MHGEGLFCEARRLHTVDMGKRQRNAVIARQRDGGLAPVLRALLQPKASPFDTGLPQPYGISKQGRISLTRCPKNRQQATVLVS